jgi:hypothetical protein
MRKELSLDEAKGKTIEDFLFSFSSEQMIITLSEGSFICFGERGYDPGSEEVTYEKLKLFDFGDYLLVKGGIISKDELDTITKKRDDELKAHQEKDERRLFEMLREKFKNT